MFKEMGDGTFSKFKSAIDAVFREGDKYLIVDWKTDKKIKSKYVSKHRQQLETYKRLLAVNDNIPLDKIEVALGFVGLRSTINTGIIDKKYDATPPDESSFDIVSERIERLLSWIKDPEQFFKDFIAEGKDEKYLWRSVVEEYNKEK